MATVRALWCFARRVPFFWKNFKFPLRVYFNLLHPSIDGAVLCRIKRKLFLRIPPWSSHLAPSGLSHGLLFPLVLSSCISAVNILVKLETRPPLRQGMFYNHHQSSAAGVVTWAEWDCPVAAHIRDAPCCQWTWSSRITLGVYFHYVFVNIACPRVFRTLILMPDWKYISRTRRRIGHVHFGWNRWLLSDCFVPSGTTADSGQSPWKSFRLVRISDLGPQSIFPLR